MTVWDLPLAPGLSVSVVWDCGGIEWRRDKADPQFWERERPWPYRMSWRGLVANFGPIRDVKEETLW